MLVLKKKGVLKELLHKRILNIGLLVSFLIVTYSSLAFIIWKDYRISIGETDDHVTWGIIMIWLSIFHLIERFWFFKAILRLKNKNIQTQKNIEN